MNRSRGIAYCVYPCPCGYFGDPTKECTCNPSMVTRYQKRTSEAGLKVGGPLLDRIDIHVDVPRVPYEKLTGERMGEPSSGAQRVSRHLVKGGASDLRITIHVSCATPT